MSIEYCHNCSKMYDQDFDDHDDCQEYEDFESKFSESLTALSKMCKAADKFISGRSK